MPELPEVETIARQLQQVLPGKVIEAVEVRNEKSFKGDETKLIGKKIKKVWRKAKKIIFELDGEMVLLIHLKMTGQLIWQPQKADTPGVFSPSGTFTPGVKDRKEKRIVGGHPTDDWVKTLPSKHTRVIVNFKDKSKLFFNDMRKFGWVKIVARDSWLVVSEKLPLDVIDPGFTLKYLSKVLKSSSRAVKLVLLDQTKIGGMGNIYVNDALWLAGIKPQKAAKLIIKGKVKELHQACVKVIKRGIEVGGASESTYKHINGMGGGYQEEFLIYKREGEVCGKNGCKGVIKKMKLGGRGTYYCPECQV